MTDPRPEAQTPRLDEDLCKCGSIDRWGDDLGEHSPTCEYHLAALAASGPLPSAEASAPRPSSLPTPARDTHYDRRMIADLRNARNEWPNESFAKITRDELDALLDAAAERDRLKADAVREPTRRVNIPAGHALVGGQVVPLETPRERDDCRWCNDAIERTTGTRDWRHVFGQAVGEVHTAEPLHA